MARKKRPVALFEVIQKDKRFERKTSVTAPVRVNRFWFLRRQPMSAIVPGLPPQSLASSRAPSQRTPIVDSVILPAALVDPAISSPAVPSPSFSSAPSLSAPVPQPLAPASTFHPVQRPAPMPARPPQWEVAYQQFLTWLTPQWALLRAYVSRQSGPLTGAAAAAAVICGILIARHLVRPTQSASAGVAMTMDQIRAQPVHSSVLDVAGATRLAQSTPSDVPATVNALPGEAQPATNTSKPARQIGLNYVLVQSYGDQKTADEARDFLGKNGVPCTIEHGVKGWNPELFQVIGLMGFAHIGAGAADYQAYYKRIQTLSDKFAPQHGSVPTYKKFEPQAMKWDRRD